MNFFERQVEARAASRRFVWLFLLAVGLVASGISAVLICALAVFQQDSPFARGLLLPDGAWLLDHIGMAISVVALVLGIILVASLYRTASLRGGGVVVARAAGGSRVRMDTADLAERRLLNIVEEMAIASGVPVPAVYVLSQEPGINAFAAGFNPSNAAIAVTRGALEVLDRDELQGVIGHEFSHIINGDMQLNIRMVGWLFGLMAIAGVARTVLRISPRAADDRRSAGALVLLFFVATVIYLFGSLGLLFGRMIQAAVARKRETLADASAVQFTRNPEGLRDALVKIGASTRSTRLLEADVDTVAHMLFAPGMARLFATHPPLIERIRALDPGFRESEFAAVRASMARAVQTAPETTDAPPPLSGRERLERILSTAVGLDATHLAESVAHPLASHLALAAAIRVSLPPAIMRAASIESAACQLFLALALDGRAEVREQQLRYIEQQLSLQHSAGARGWLAHVDALNPMQRQPALLRLLPALRRVQREKRASLLACLNGLLQRGGAQNLEQYCLRKLAQVALRDVARSAYQPRAVRLAVARPAIGLLLAILARHGHADPAAAAAAFQRGMSQLFPGDPFNQPIPANWPPALDLAFSKLDLLASADKQRLLIAMGATISHDGKVLAPEAELLRAACACIHCPLPPLLGDAPAPIAATASVAAHMA